MTVRATLEETWLFAPTYSPTCGNSQSKTKRFDDRLSLERARHELKKKLVFLPNDLSLDEWYVGGYALPDVSMLEASNLRRVVGYDFHHIRKQHDVPYPPTMAITTAASRGLVGTRLQKEKSGSLPTGLICLKMI